MKKLFIALTGLVIIAFSSCTKDNSQATSISPSDSSAVSAALKIWHGTKIQGSPTGNNDGSLVLDSTAVQIQSYKGGYAVITPNILSGNIAGYYVRVDGANNYFKVDFSASLNRPVINTTANRPVLGLPNRHKNIPVIFSRPTDNAPDYSDSTIVIQLPQGITTGTFCMEYWAYDANGYISDSVQVCITIDQLGASDGTSFTGNWMLSGYKIPANSFDTTIDTTWHYNVSDSTNILDYQTGFYCVDGYVSQDPGSYFDPANGTINSANSSSESIPDYIWFKSFNLTLSANGAYLATGENVNKQFDADLYSQLVQCGNIPYDREDQVLSATGGWSYNATTNKFIIVEQDSSTSVADTHVEEYDIQQKTNSQFVIISNESDEASLMFIRR